MSKSLDSKSVVNIINVIDLLTEYDAVTWTQKAQKYFNHNLLFNVNC